MRFWALAGLIIALFIPAARAADQGLDSATMKVSKLVIAGNKAFSSSKIKGIGLRLAPSLFHAPVFTMADLRRDTVLIGQFYESNGFMKVRIMADTALLNPRRHRIKVSVTINEGPRTTISGVRIQGVPSADQAGLLALASALHGAPLRVQDLINDAQAFTNWLGDRGRLEAVVNYHYDFFPDSLSASVTYEIQAGPVIRTASVAVMGLKRVHERVVTQCVDFQKDEVVTRIKLREAIDNLYSINLFSFVMVSFDSLLSPVTGDSSSRVIRVRVFERKYFSGVLGAGYQTYEQMRGRAELSYGNFIGLGIRGYAIGYANMINQGAELGGTVPRIQGTPLDFNSKIGYRHQNEPRIQMAGTYRKLDNSVTYHFSQQLRASLIHRLETSRLSVVPPVLPANIGAPFTHSMAIEATRDTRDDLLDPHHGSFMDFTTTFSGLTGKASNHFIKIEGDGRVYLPLGKSVVLASGIYGGIAMPYSPSRAVPVPERFYLGGSKVMRGFGDKQAGPDSSGTPTGGTLYLASNVLEVRYTIYKWIWGDVFFDAGNLWDVQSSAVPAFIKEVSKLNLLYNAGFGLRVHISVVIVSLDVGFRLNDGAGSSKNPAFHFMVGNSF